MKKGIYSIMFSVISLVLMTACTDIDDPVIGTLQPAEMVSSTPANGATGIPDEDITLVLTYNQNVFSPSTGHELITLSGGAKITSISASLTNVTIKATGLEKGKTYQLTVSEGAIVGPTKVGALEAKVSFSTVANKPIQTKLVTPDALPAAQKVYDYLLTNYGKKTLSGAMAKVSWNIDEAERVHTLTGKYPAIAFFDYIHLYASPANWIDYSNTQVVEDWWNNNGLIGASWHWNVPKSENAAANEVTYDPTQTTFTVTKALADGTWENGVLKADLQKMAGYLKLLQDKGIPVIWRPLHEAAGNIYEFEGGKAWFWWGNDGADAFKKLWVYMFDYFKNEGVKNLIWVWTSQVKDGEFYPGDGYVDMIARDLYGKTAAQAQEEYAALKKSYAQKMITLGECGANVDGGKALDKLSAIWSAGATWSFFMPWYDNDGATMLHADNAWWQDAMGQTYVITRSDLPSMK